VRQASVVVVSGSADHMDQVLRKAQMKFVVVRPDELPNLPLHSQQVLMVNCRGEMSAAARDRVRRFVAAGGFLYTTDHAVHELVEKIFPMTIAWNHTSTQEGIFPMQTTGTRAPAACSSTWAPARRSAGSSPAGATSSRCSTRTGWRC